MLRLYKNFNCPLCVVYAHDIFWVHNLFFFLSRSQWPRGLRRRSAAARLLRSWVQIPPWAWMFVCCECCVLSGIGLCGELITRPEESYRLRCVVMCDLENLKNEEAMTRTGSQRHSKKYSSSCTSQDLNTIKPCIYVIGSDLKVYS